MNQLERFADKITKTPKEIKPLPWEYIIGGVQFEQSQH